MTNGPRLVLENRRLWVETSMPIGTDDEPETRIDRFPAGAPASWLEEAREGPVPLIDAGRFAGLHIYKREGDPFNLEARVEGTAKPAPGYPRFNKEANA